MIGLSAQSSSSSAYIIIKEHKDTSELDRFSRRISRTATLDGGVVIVDSGQADGDKTLRIQAQLTETERDTVAYIIQNYSLINVATKQSFYSGVIQNVRLDGGRLDMTIWIKE